ncbi:transcription repressor OFP13-like [Miscanthus floridulus]|uniref:transcription repressor OFP13-like n=1 Tax=Miscanthus floridulus TaxID=154761 RepID=UPI003457DBF7
MVTRRLALSSLFHGKARDTSLPPPPPPATTAGPAAWPWPSSKNPRAQSTRATTPQVAGAGRTTIASIVLDSADSSFTASSARQDCCSDSLSTASEASAAACDDAADDAVVRGIRSDRLLFDPGASATNSILEEKNAAAACAGAKQEEEEEEAFGGAVAVAFESADPYADFRASMEEMMAAHGIGDWGWLEEMLGWYLRANDGDTHCAIVAAFIDVVVDIADPAREACSSEASSCTFAAGELDVAEKVKPAAVFTVSCLD